MISTNLGTNLLNFAMYSIAVLLYVIVIWHFYQQLSKKNLFEEKIKHPESVKRGILHSLWHLIIFLFKYLLVFPLISFLWFLILSGFLLFLSKSSNVTQILMMATTVIAASRMSAYYKEDLSKDVAKLIPLTLLGVFIVDPTYFSLEDTISKFNSIPLFIHVIIQSLLFLVIIEFSLHIVYKIKTHFISEPDNE
ncbi:MAG: hypothetical protein V1859_11530 [archaeon]